MSVREIGVIATPSAVSELRSAAPSAVFFASTQAHDMRDATFNSPNSYLGHAQQACDRARNELGVLDPPSDVLPALARWVRHSLFNSNLLEARSDRRDFSDLLELTGDRAPSVAFDRVSAATSQAPLRKDFLAFLNDPDGPCGGSGCLAFRTSPGYRHG